MRLRWRVGCLLREKKAERKSRFLQKTPYTVEGGKNEVESVVGVMSLRNG
jgi:hypothetical protein